jgi:hypothetical protein
VSPSRKLMVRAEERFMRQPSRACHGE